MTPLEELILDLLRRPAVPALFLDERRFGRTEGFDEERIVFAGVLTTIGTAAAFGLAVEAARV